MKYLKPLLSFGDQGVNRFTLQHGPLPEFDTVLATLREAEDTINAT